MVEGARLEIVWAEMSRRFESSRFRQKIIGAKWLLLIKNNTQVWVLFLFLLNFLLNFGWETTGFVMRMVIVAGIWRAVGLGTLETVG